MTSVVSICNLALSNIGKENINALSEPTPEARACNQFYDLTRDTLLQSYPWRFAGKTHSLAEIENDKPGTWGRAYARPNDCLKIRWIRPAYSALDSHTQSYELSHPYDVEGATIYCNLSPAFLRYTYRLTDQTRFSPLFVDALAWHLAARLAMPMTHDPKVRADAYQLGMRMQSLAEMADANEVRETSDHECDLIAGRS